MTRSHTPPRSRSVLWFTISFLAGIVVVFVGISFAQEVRRRIALQEHIQKLREEIHEREQRVADLRRLAEYLRTDAYQERAAREKLNYQRPGERVVVVPESGAVRGATNTVSARIDTERADTPIPRQWWELLFGPP